MHRDTPKRFAPLKAHPISRQRLGVSRHVRMALATRSQEDILLGVGGMSRRAATSERHDLSGVYRRLSVCRASPNTTVRRIVAFMRRPVRAIEAHPISRQRLGVSRHVGMPLSTRYQGGILLRVGAMSRRAATS